MGMSWAVGRGLGHGERLWGGGSGPRSGVRGSISACPPQLSDRTESLNRSIKKRYVWLLPRQDPWFSRGGRTQVLQGKAGPRVLQGKAEEGAQEVEVWGPRELWRVLRVRHRAEGRALGQDPSLPSNSVKRSQPALPISKIDERLEQYTQAVEVGTGALTFCWVLSPIVCHFLIQPVSLH